MVADRDRPGATATLSPGEAARLDAAGLMRMLDRYPYRCSEQSASRAMPLLSMAPMARELGIDHIGKVYDVHRATAARWLTRARESLFEMTRSHLRAELGLDDDEFQSLVRLVRSRLDVSVCRILAEDAADG